MGIAPVYDAVRDRAIVVPSALAPGRQFGSTDTVLTLVLTPGSAAWLPVTPAGTAPFLHLRSRLVLDAVRDRVLMIGGYTADLGGGGSATNDTWALDLSGGMAWSNLIAADGQFLLGAEPGACIDPTLDRVLIFGGTTASSAEIGTYNTVAGISLEGLANLVNLDPSFTSPMLGGGAAFFDAAHDRALFWNNTLWELTWDFGSPVSLGAGTATADVGGIHLHWAGVVLASYSATVERSADGGASWSHLAIVTQQPDGSLDATDASPPPGGPFVYRLLIQRQGSWRVIGTAALGNLGAPVLQRPRLFALGLLQPNPSRGDVVVELALPADAGVTLELFDIAGRRVGPTVRHRVSAGRVSFPVGLARGVAPGLYLVRASDGLHHSHARLAVIR